VLLEALSVELEGSTPPGEESVVSMGSDGWGGTLWTGARLGTGARLAAGLLDTMAGVVTLFFVKLFFFEGPEDTQR